MRRGSIIKRIPNVLTLTNMMLGLAAVLFLLQENHPQKSLIVPGFILLGGIADFFDGFLARRLNATTQVGKQLDSFADLITFGIASVSFVNYLGNWGHSVPIIASSLLFVAAGAYRLARYNLGDFSDYFMGLPIPGAGIILAAYGMVFYRLGFSEIVTSGVLVLLSGMMVSKKKVVRRV